MQVFETNGLLEKHMTTVHGNMYPCNDCELSFDNSTDLNTHIKSVHNADNSNQQRMYDSNYFMQQDKLRQQFYQHEQKESQNQQQQYQEMFQQAYQYPYNYQQQFSNYQQQQQFDPNQGSIIQMLQKQHRDHQDLIIHMQKERDKERDRERKELEKERREFMSQQQHQF
jgi:hypothetical protein